MKVLTKPTAKQVLEMWRNQYYDGVEWQTYDEGWALQPKQIYDKIKKLGKAATKAKIDKIIGNDGWTVWSCGECGEEQTKLIELFGSDTHPSGWTFFICKECLAKATKLLNK